MNSILAQRWRARLADPCVHEWLWYCVPGVVAGLLVRAWLTAGMPYGHYHFDTPDFLETPANLLAGHGLKLHFKKTFLTPYLYTLPFLCRLPALIVIPLGQHLLGLLMILMTGALCRLWFFFWRWFIVPLTILIALHPALLWFEHTLLAETHYVFGVVWIALAGSLFVRRAGWEALGFLLAALLFTAGARPEGRLFLSFGVLLVLGGFWGHWRREIRKILVLFAFCVGVLLITRTGQGGVLLYASILHLAPDHSNFAPDVLECLGPLRDQLRQERNARISNDVVRAEKRLGNLILDCYAPKHPELHLSVRSKSNPKALSAFCLRLAIETVRNHPLQLPRIVVDRFLYRINDDSGGQFRNHDLQTRQARSLKRGADRNAGSDAGLAGVSLISDDSIRAFVSAHYDERRVDWFNRWEKHWMEAIGYFHLPDLRYSAESTLPGLPWFYLVALAGSALALIIPTRARFFHWIFLPVLGGVWFAVTLTGALMPRYRFALEPFWLLYLFFLADACARLIERLLPKTEKNLPSMLPPGPDVLPNLP